MMAGGDMMLSNDRDEGNVQRAPDKAQRAALAA
jgi:hypothetical protein